MNFHPFVLPFSIAALFLFIMIALKFYNWIKNLDRKQQYFFKKNFFSKKTLLAIKEVFSEALIHNNIYKKNPLLGYMHMSLAFGWFLLIIVGKIESSIYAGTIFEEAWLGIFFKFFAKGSHSHFMAAEFAFLMDLLLLIVLSGVLLALFKRLKSNALGMQKATKHNNFDKIALTALWFVFPLRLLAESTTSAIYSGGGFLTGSLGNILTHLPAQQLELPFWWAYSGVLAIFFVSLPFSRYMHIPTEIVYIFLKNWGTTAGEEYSGYSDIQLNSCSRCGICIDSCQLNYAANINNVQSVYLIRDSRYKKLTDEVANNCLMCGRCVESCPVNLELTVIRQQLRNKKEIAGKHYYNYTQKEEDTGKSEVIYFAGCMTHLTPGIVESMKKIFAAAKVDYWFMDEDRGVCCGRPLRQQGFVQQSKDLINKNLRMINSSGAKLLVSSCPICYKSFTEEYVLDIKVMHHSEYIKHLLDTKQISVSKTNKSVVYHDPCELGRGSQIYEYPREVLKQIYNLNISENERENALCCGGSLSNAILELEDQIKIRNNALKILTKSKPDYLATSCPLCKKAFIHGHKVKVSDISEIVAKNIITTKKTDKIKHKTNNHIVKELEYN